MDWPSLIVLPVLGTCPMSPTTPALHSPTASAPIYDWPEHKEPVDREPDHPAEGQGTLVFGVGASASGFSNVAA